MSTDKVVVLASGGLDSSVLLINCLAKYGVENVHALHINYGAKQTVAENRALTTIYGKLSSRGVQVSHSTVVLDFSQFSKNSALLSSSVDVPKGADATYESSKKTYVPFRNGIMLSYATAYAIDNGFNLVTYACIGSAAGNPSHPDSSKEFVEAFSEVILLGTYGKVRLLPPGADSKTNLLSILRKDYLESIHYDVNAFLSDTFSCYDPVAVDGKLYACKECKTCQGRARAFKSLGWEDPTIYADMMR